MNRRGANPVQGIPGRAVIDWQLKPATVKTKDKSSKKPTEMVNDTISRLAIDVQLLKRKVEFLQKVDLSVLSDDIGSGDVTFIVKNNEVVKAHRFILASKSSIFKKMFDTNMREKFSGEIRVKDVSAPVLRALIEFLYTAEIKFTDAVTATDLFMVAHKYDIPELQAECEIELYRSVSEDNLSEMMRISHLYGMKRLMSKCVQILRDNFDRVHERLLTDLLS